MARKRSPSGARVNQRLVHARTGARRIYEAPGRSFARSPRRKSTPVAEASLARDATPVQLTPRGSRAWSLRRRAIARIVNLSWLGGPGARRQFTEMLRLLVGYFVRR